MDTIKYPQCAVQSRGHVMNFIQLRLGVGKWKREGVFTAGRVLAVGDHGFDFGTDDGVVRLHHHHPHHIQVAITTYGDEAVLLDQGVFVVLGAQQDAVFSGSATFSVATTDQVVPCRTDSRPGDNSGFPVR